MTPRYKYLPQENDFKFKIIRKDKYAFYFFAVTIGTDFQLDLSLLTTHQPSLMTPQVSWFRTLDSRQKEREVIPRYVRRQLQYFNLDLLTGDKMCWHNKTHSNNIWIELSSPRQIPWIIKIPYLEPYYLILRYSSGPGLLNNNMC